LIALLGSVLLASLLGSPHCAAMCGSFVCFYAAEPGHPRAWLPHATYNLGRLLSYVSLGVVAGVFGAGLDRAGAAVGIGRVAAILAGTLLVVWGASTLLRAAGVRVPDPAPAGLAHRTIARVLARVRRQPAALRALVVGLVTTLLPCGFLYVFVASAAAAGRPGTGALVMAGFWLGTLPVMAGLGFAAGRALGPFRRRLPLVSAALLVVLGLLTISGRMHLAPAAFAASTGHHDCH